MDGATALRNMGCAARSDHWPSGKETPSAATWTVVAAGFKVVARRIGSAEDFQASINPGSARYMLVSAESAVVTAGVWGQSLSSTQAAACLRLVPLSRTISQRLGTSGYWPLGVSAAECRSASGSVQFR